MVIQGCFGKYLIALTALIAFKFSKCEVQSRETGGFVSFHNIGIVLCQITCSQHGPCVAIEYNIDSSTCRLLHVESEKPEEGAIVRSGLEPYVYKGPCTPKSCTQTMICLETRSGKAACVKEPGGMYEWCADDNVCYISGAVCFKGLCKCTPGFSYHQAEQACVRRCDVYGKTMTTYDGLAILLHDRLSYSDLPEEECIRLCVNETTFLCLSAEMNKIHGACHLSEYGYLDVNRGYRASGTAAYNVATRDCETQ